MEWIDGCALTGRDIRALVLFPPFLSPPIFLVTSLLFLFYIHNLYSYLESVVYFRDSVLSFFVHLSDLDSSKMCFFQNGL